MEVLHRAGQGGTRPGVPGRVRARARRGADLVIVMDADFSHDPQHLPAMIAAARESDLVLGSRYVAGGEITNWPRLRRVLSRSGSLYARLMLGVKVRDLTTGFRCVRRRVLESVEPSTLRSQGYVFNIELTYRALLAGFSVKEIPICFRDREEGESKMSLPIAVEALRLVPKLRGLRTEVVEQRSNGAVRNRRRALALTALAAPPRGTACRAPTRPASRVRTPTTTRRALQRRPPQSVREPGVELAAGAAWRAPWPACRGRRPPRRGTRPAGCPARPR